MTEAFSGFFFLIIGKNVISYPAGAEVGSNFFFYWPYYDCCRRERCISRVEQREQVGLMEYVCVCGGLGRESKVCREQWDGCLNVMGIPKRCWCMTSANMGFISQCLVQG